METSFPIFSASWSHAFWESFEVMGLPSPEAALQHHHSLLGRAALSIKVGHLVALGFPCGKCCSWGVVVNSEIRKVLAHECHDRPVQKHLHKFLDLLEEIHGRNMNCPWGISKIWLWPQPYFADSQAWTHQRNPKNAQSCGNKTREDHSFGWANQHERVSWPRVCM